MNVNNMKHLSKLDLLILPLLEEELFTDYYDAFGYPKADICNKLAAQLDRDRGDIYVTLKFIRAARERANALTPKSW